MNTPSPRETCPKCGRPIPPEAREGLCPSCALAAAAAPTEPGPFGEDRPPPPSREALAAALPQFEILELIGQGGMGCVYKARQPQLNRLIALKILPETLGRGIKFTDRFLREAQALARLSHPNIVTIYDFGHGGGFSYLVMEYVDGTSLRHLLGEGALKPEQALAIVPKICEALQSAHEQGVVHRDIKPENVLLDKQGRVKIADFGIAKLVAAEGPHPALTEERSVIGTPHYMAPEQIEHPRLVDHRADIYSLGVVFYEMLTGELPLGKFPPPSKKVRVDVRLDEVVLHTLEKEPERRYQHADEVKTAIETIAATAPPTPIEVPQGPPSAAREPGPTGLAKATLQRELRTPAWGLVGSGIVQLLVGFSLVVFALPAVAREGGDAGGYAVLGGMAGLSLMAALIVLLGARGMLQGRHYGLAMVASGVAMMAGPAALVGLPFGIWSLMLLNRPDIKAAFQSADREASPEPTAPMAERPPAPAPVVIARWTARALGALFVLLALPFVLAEGLPPIASQPEGVQLTFFGAFLLLLGFIIGWWREGTASLLVAAGWTVIRVSESRFQLFTVFELTLVVAALYGFCWWATRGRQTRVVAASVVVLAVSLGLGRLFVPTSVFVEGSVTDARTGGPVANAELRLNPGSVSARQTDAVPQARTDEKGRFRLYLGWYSGGRPLAISAAGYTTLATQLGPRALGRRRVSREFALSPEFSPTIEVTLNGVDESRGGEALDLTRGRLIDLPQDIKRQPADAGARWLGDHGVDLLLDRVGGRWGLLSPNQRALKLAPLPGQSWDTITQDELSGALGAEPVGLEIRQHAPWQVYVLPAEARLPLTFAFETAGGLRGVLQISRLTETPDSAQLRFKRVEGEAASRDRNETLVRERAIHSITAQRPIRSLDLDSGEEIELTVAQDGSGVYASIQAALDEAGEGAVVRIGPGRYEEPLLITRPVTLIGAGWDTTVIGPTNAAVGPTEDQAREYERQIRGAATDAERNRLRQEIQDRFFRPAVRIQGAAGVRLERIRFTLPGAAPAGKLLDTTVLEARDAQATLDACAIVASPGNGIVVGEGADVNISRTLVAAVWNSGIRVERGTRARVTIVDSDIRNCHYAGVVVGRGQNSVRIERCRVSGAAWHGIRYDHASPTIADNLIFANARSGVYASGKSTARVRGNVFWRNEMTGMSCWFDNQDQIEQNTFADNRREGLSVLGASVPTIERNVFWQNPQGIVQGHINDDSPAAKAAESLRLRDNLFWTNDVHVASAMGLAPGETNAPPSVPLATFPGNLEVDPGFRDAAAGDFALLPGRAAAGSGRGAAAVLAPASPWPLQPEEQAIIPGGESRDHREWKRPSGA